MNQLLFDRSTGNLSPQAFAQVPTTERIYSIQPAPRARFNGGEKEVALDAGSRSIGGGESQIWAHQFGVNALAIDIENRLLISGGADSSIKIWDLEKPSNVYKHTSKPSGELSRSASAHKFGITALSFYPFDSEAFLSSSYDHHLKLFATETLEVSADFDMSSNIYSHAMSPIANHLLVACATQHPTVRLVDLRSGSNTHSLAGHIGALLSVVWSPTAEHILASGGIDGTVQLWDIRKSSGAIGMLDLEDSLGITGNGTNEMGRIAHSRSSAKAHAGAVNGLTWTDNGSFIISAGQDERVRVWNTTTGANTLASFGPTLKNSHLSSLPLVVSPTSMTPRGKEILFYPNEKELLMFELHEGKLLRRLKVPGPAVASVRSRTGERNIKSRITGLVWRGEADGVYSAHTDGQIRAWLPRTTEDEMLDREEEESLKRQTDGDDMTKRKRKLLDDVFRDLTRQKITFG